MTQHQIAIDGREGAGFPQHAQDTILRAALRSGVGFPYECNSGGCGSCKFDLVSGTVENLWPEAPAITERDRRKGRLLACQSRATSDACVRFRPQPEYQPLVVPRRMRAKLIEVRSLTHDIREFRFRTREPADFLAGQYVMLTLPGMTSPRAYSMSNTANRDTLDGGGEWHLQIRRVPHGRATDVLFHHLETGGEVEMDGPFGLAFLRHDAERDIVCVAGGSGLAPMISIARGATQSGMLQKCHLHFFYGGRTPRDICGEDLLKMLPGFGDKIHFYPVVSMPLENPASPWTGETGFVHELVRRKFGEELPKFEFYFAGPPPMTNSLHEMLMVGYRVPFHQIHFDRFF